MIQALPEGPTLNTSSLGIRISTHEFEEDTDIQTLAPNAHQTSLLSRLNGNSDLGPNQLLVLYHHCSPCSCLWTTSVFWSFPSQTMAPPFTFRRKTKTRICLNSTFLSHPTAIYQQVLSKPVSKFILNQLLTSPLLWIHSKPPPPHSQTPAITSQLNFCSHYYSSRIEAGMICLKGLSHTYNTMASTIIRNEAQTLASQLLSPCSPQTSNTSLSSVSLMGEGTEQLPAS